MSRNSMNCKEVLLGTVCRRVVPARLYALAVVVLAFAMLALFSIVSCSSEQPAQTSTPSAIATATPTALATATSFAPRTSPTPGLPRISLRVWVPPEFGPAPNSRDLDEIVEKFEEAYPGILVQISAKQAAGKGGLLDLLQGASQVAPGYVPDLVLMDDAETARAAGQNLLEAVDSFLSIPAEDLVFTNLLAVGVSGDMRYGIPYAMDFLHLAYRVPVTPSVPMNWAHILESGGRYLFASGASENYTSDSILIQYLGLDGVLTDAGGKTTLDSRILTRVLDAYNQLAESGALAAESLTLNSPNGAWSLYKIGEATFAEVWASQFIAEASSASGTAFARIPTRNGRAATLVHVWTWSITARTPERQQAAADFLQWVLEASRQRTWSQAAGFLPSSPQSWPLSLTPTEYSQFLLDLARQASPFPAALRSTEVSSALQEALAQVITADIPPKQSAEQAIAKMRLQ